MNTKKHMIALLLCLTLTLPTLLSGCSTTAQGADLMAGVKPNSVSTDVDLGEEEASAVTDFAVQLFQKSLADGKNTLISPISVLCALAMTANGARGETLAQMEDVFGLPVTELNKNLHAYMEALPSGDKYKLSLANSIWFKNHESFTVKQDFLQTNADWYGANLYKAAFDDTTLKAINNWVRDNTDGMIKDILDEIPDEAVMYLVNALAFDAEWQSIYEETQVRNGSFTTAAGTVRDTDLMYSREQQYLEDDNAVGFIKYYKDNRYAFAALLPDEGLSVSDYAASLTGKKLGEILGNARSIPVNAAIPKFESEYNVEMSDILKAMGMTDAFDDAVADFSGIGSSTEGNLYISRVLHKTYIAVNERGTKAGAATVVEVKNESAMVEPDELKTVFLNRPFVYMLIDCETNLPVFIGTVMDTGA